MKSIPLQRVWRESEKELKPLRLERTIDHFWLPEVDITGYRYSVVLNGMLDVENWFREESLRAITGLRWSYEAGHGRIPLFRRGLCPIRRGFASRRVSSWGISKKKGLTTKLVIRPFRVEAAGVERAASRAH